MEIKQAKYFQKTTEPLRKLGVKILWGADGWIYSGQKLGFCARREAKNRYHITTMMPLSTFDKDCPNFQSAVEYCVKLVLLDLSKKVSGGAQ